MSCAFLRFLLVGFLFALSVSVRAAPPDFVPATLVDEARGSYIVIFSENIGADRVAPLARSISAREGAAPRHVFRTAIRGFSATLPEVAARRIAQLPQVAYVERNGVAWAIEAEAGMRPAGRGGNGGSTQPETQTVPYGVTRVGGPLDGSGKHAWVIDTGIDTGHADLLVGSGANFVRRGKNTVNDGNGHGTHVAGTIAALNNTIDVVGVAAGATVHPVRVLDDTGNGTIDGVIAGVDYVAATASPGDVANMSLVAAGYFQSLHDAVVNAASQGIRFAVAAGNESAYAMDSVPANVDAANVFTVSAIDADDVFADFSNWGNPPIDFAAPGVGILSTKKGGGVTTLSGTSMATPHVAGLLLFATPSVDGYAIGDVDGIADPIAHH